MQQPLQRRQALEARFPRWRTRTLSQALDHAAAEFADRPLLFAENQTYTYSDMQAWSRDMAAGLIALGVKAGDHVAVMLANYPEFVALKFAIARAGAVAVPINLLLRRQELSYILQQSDATVLIVMDCLRDRNYLDDLDAIAPGWETQGGGSQLPRLRHVLIHSTGNVARANALPLANLAVLGTASSRAELSEREAAGDPAFRSDVIYTSGTTGSPKGVMLTHDMILRAAYASAYTRAFEDGRRILFALPLYHVFGYVECLISAMFVGGAIIPHVVFDPQKMLEATQRHGATELVCVPTMTLKLLELAPRQDFDGSKLLAVFNSGGISPLSIWSDIRSVLGAREVMTAYGMTETTASTTCTLPEGPDSLLASTHGRFKFAGSAGDPALNGILALYKVVDPATGKDVAPGTPGELVARGPIVTQGYYKKPEETRAAIDPEGWLHTGDVGIIDEQGNLSLTGRIKETYRCGGEMVMPREIEELLATHPQVAQAVAVGVPDVKMGEIGCVFIVPRVDSKPAPQELIDLCASNLARFKVPRHILFINERDLPVTATGRVQKFRLVELAKQRLTTETSRTSSASG